MKMIATLLICYLSFIIRFNQKAANGQKVADHRRKPHHVTTDIVVVACVGDSLTSGSGSTNRKKKSYPGVLRRMKFFHGNFSVHNFGVDGMTALRNAGKWSYWNTKQFAQVEKVSPNIIVIQLGTNDAKLAFWNESTFRRDYKALVLHFMKSPKKPQIYLCTPPPLYKTPKVFYGFIPEIINERLPKVIEEMSRELGGLKVIDNFNYLGGITQSMPQFYTINPKKPMGTWPNDGCHLSDVGYEAMAISVAKTLVQYESSRLNLSVNSLEEAMKITPPTEL